MTKTPTAAKIAALTDVDETTILYPQTVKSAILDWDGTSGGTENTAGNGISIVDGVVSAKLSTDAGNSLSLGTDSGLFSSGGGKRCARVIIGTSEAGWTSDDCDFLCDGTNDNAVIQSALNSLEPNYGEVIFLSGIYKISQTIASYRISSLRGSGGMSFQYAPNEPLNQDNYKGRTVLKWVGSYSNDQKINGTSNINCMVNIGYITISNICFDMGNIYASECNICVSCPNGAKISNCTFSNCSVGVYIYSPVTATVSNCLFFTYGKAGAIMGQGSITSSYFSNAASIDPRPPAIDVRCSTNHVLIHGNTVHGNIAISGYSKPVLVYGNIVSGSIVDSSNSGYNATITNNLTNFPYGF